MNEASVNQQSSSPAKPVKQLPNPAKLCSNKIQRAAVAVTALLVGGMAIVDSANAEIRLNHDQSKGCKSFLQILEEKSGLQASKLPTLCNLPSRDRHLILVSHQPRRMLARVTRVAPKRYFAREQRSSSTRTPPKYILGYSCSTSGYIQTCIPISAGWIRYKYCWNIGTSYWSGFKNTLAEAQSASLNTCYKFGKGCRLQSCTRH